MIAPKLMSAFGILAMLAFAFLLSTHKKRIYWRTVAFGLGLQLLFAFIILRTSIGRTLFDAANATIVALMDYQLEGARLVFGGLADAGSSGFIFAFQVLTSIIFLSALMSILYYLGVMQFVVRIFAKAMRRIFVASGAESLSASANIFMGQTEAPLVVRPYVKDMTRSELLCIMIGGMATVSGGVMGAYVGLLRDDFPDIAGHIMAASVMAAPAGMMIAKILLPETEVPKTRNGAEIDESERGGNVLEAAANGAEMGMRLALIVATMLMAFMGLLALGNGVLGSFGAYFGYPDLSFQVLLSYVFAPLAYLMGVPWEECGTVGLLIGTKTTLSELVAYSELATLLKESPEALSSRSVLICSYALCGFANFMSIGIQVGGIGAIAPERKAELAGLGIRALIGGTLATCITASVAALLA